ncbi:MAG: nucleotidyl transferase AbiEii/AbiGii toxin family protein [Anaerolineae bacterium]|nr:nucleotidyl transferase AbiEii/AbiGii toxin family protein [Anaerolineae bacterium]
MTSSQILTPFQNEFLDRFYRTALGQKFFLTGGTALAAFYLEHRFSEDIDLFTLDDDALGFADRTIQQVAQELGASFSISVATPTFRQMFLTIPTESLKIDLVRDINVQFGAHWTVGRVIVDSLENIGVNKVLAIFGRTTSKDFVDLYFILQEGYSLGRLVTLAKEKDPGLTEFYLAGMMRQVRNLDRLPRMIKPLELPVLRQFFLDLEQEMLRNIKPA